MNTDWVKAFEEYERISGFEPMYLEEVQEGELTPQEAWNMNIQWLESILAEVTHINTPFEEDLT